MFRHPIFPALGEQIEKVPNRAEEIDAAMMAAAKGPFGSVEVMDLAIGRTLEDTDGRMLVIVAGFDIKVAVEGISMARKQTDLAPAAPLAPSAELLERCTRHKDKVDLVSNVMRNSVVTIGPHAAHRASAVVLGRVHQVVDDEATLAILKKTGKASVKEVGRIVVAQVARAFAEHIVLLDLRARGKLAPELGDALTLVLQSDFRCKQFIAKAAVFGRFTLNRISRHATSEEISDTRL